MAVRGCIRGRVAIQEGRVVGEFFCRFGRHGGHPRQCRFHLLQRCGLPRLLCLGNLAGGQSEAELGVVGVVVEGVGEELGGVVVVVGVGEGGGDGLVEGGGGGWVEGVGVGGPVLGEGGPGGGVPVEVGAVLGEGGGWGVGGVGEVDEVLPAFDGLGPLVVGHGVLGPLVGEGGVGGVVGDAVLDGFGGLLGVAVLVVGVGEAGPDFWWGVGVGVDDGLELVDGGGPVVGGDGELGGFDVEAEVVGVVGGGLFEGGGGLVGLVGVAVGNGEFGVGVWGDVGGGWWLRSHWRRSMVSGQLRRTTASWAHS